MLRPPIPEDLYRFRVPTDPQLSPDGSLVAVTVQSVAPIRDGYRHAVWLVPSDGSAPPRQVTLGARNDTRPRFSPDGTTLAFLSDRRPLVEEEPAAPKDREDCTQVHLLPLGGGEARRLTDLPRGVDAFEWSPDGRSLVVRTTSFAATQAQDRKARGKPKVPKPGATPTSDYRFHDRLQNMLNGPGFIDDKVGHLWLVDVATGAARRLTHGPTTDEGPAWSPDGTRIAFTSSRGRDHDLDYQFDVFVVDVATTKVTRITDGAGCAFGAATWLPDGATLALAGHRWPRRGGSRSDVWLFAADGSESHRGGGRNLSGHTDLHVAANMGSDVTPAEAARLRVTPDGAHLLFTAPVDGSYELWRIALADGSVRRVTEDRHYLSGWDTAWTTDRATGAAPVGAKGEAIRVAAIRSSGTAFPDVHVLDLAADGSAAGDAELRRVSAFNDDLLAGIDVRAPEARRETVDGRGIQGWLIRSAAAERGEAAPLVLEIHGGPHTLVGWAPYWEFQVLAGAGVSVLFTNPRGSEGYGEDFNSANLPDWGEGPMRDVMAHVDALVRDGVADPARLGVTGGSYGGYLTNWIIGHTDRFAAAMTCRTVSDLTSLMLTGDLAGGIFGILEFGAQPWEKPDLYRELSPITYADRIHTPLLIQHAENDLRCPIGQGEALFAVLRTLKRPVRFMRVPDETHELTRSGTPFRRVENLVQVRGWFDHFLVKGKKRLPPRPAVRAGI